ncbi:MAG TPA: GMC family oxidoreductase N-terminal domain-containing protein, partial [Solirubrobacterales bacterium]|nr:GMC family oxidoreductase N-terminal domain-containing protein [Solirubrobacterales bacterium]
MAVAQAVLGETRRATLAALCETFVPALERESADPVEAAFLARGASDLQVAAQIEALIAEALMPEEIEAVGGLLDALAAEGFDEAPLEARTQIVHGFRAADPEAKHGLHRLKALTVLFFYALPDEAGSNPNWEAIGYPGPASPPPGPEQAPKTIAVERVSGDSATLSADVCVVGSGSGGAVIAARCAAAGRDVLVLEMGSYNNEQDFKQLELPGYLDLYYGGGLAGSESGSIGILAGQTLGGGTVVNYMNCVRTPEDVLREWDAEHGLAGLGDPSFVAEHVDVVMERLGANTEATAQNAIHQRLIAGCDGLGYEHRPIWRNASLDDDPANCGYCPAGCQHGCKRSALKTWLQDASDSGARALVGCHAERLLVEDGRATGVEATVTHADGTTTAVTVEAPTVVVAGGAVESPALLLRSGIGGPAVGKHLRLHPAYAVIGAYADEIRGWEGQIQSALSDHFAGIEDGCGFLIEATGLFPGLLGASYPWTDGAAHKELMQTLPWHAPFITVARDHGSGEVALDEHGRAVVRWELDDEVDARLARRANVELAKLHRAAGAQEVFTLHEQETRWREGEDFDAFLAAVEGASYAPNDVSCFTAH